MKWEPLTPVYSKIQPKLNVFDYKKDYKFDFINPNKSFGEYVEGFESFEQKFITVLLCNKTPIIKYGLFELLPISNDQLEFNNQCSELSKAIINHKFSDSTASSPNGLGHTVEAIYSISRENENNIHYLFIECKVIGIDDYIIIKVPLTFIKD